MINTTNNTKLFLGIDGGGSTCRARLCDIHNNILGEGNAGPANFRLGLPQVKQQIEIATQAALDQAGLGQQPFNTLHAGIGLAGAVLESDQQLALPVKHLFATCQLSDDAYIACLGAHRGKPGGIVILGTGSCAQIITPQASRTYGGWGFVLGDHGGGASLGREAIRLSLLALESIIPPSPLTDAINQRFQNTPQDYLNWSMTAKPQDYARFAPIVFEYAEQKDPQALSLVFQATADITHIINVLDRYNTGRISLLGGLSARYPAYLSDAINRKLSLPMGDALDGALIMAQGQHKENQC